MQKNVAGQRIGVQMVSAADGSAFTGSVTVYVTGDAGSQAIGSVGSGVCTHEGNGYHSYAPAQAETNFDLIAFTFVGSGAVPVTVQVYTAINPVTAVPTAAANASAVRSELTTELARIDVATSTRLASGSYTAPPSAATVAGAVWDKATVGHTSTGSFGAGVGYIITTVAAILVGVNQLTSRITSTLFSGITRLSHWLGAIAGKTADTITRTEINATTAGATYNEITDSQEAIRDRGDAAWSTAASGAVYVLPTKGTQQDRRASTDEIRIYRTEGYTLVRTVTDATGANVDLLGKTLELIIEGENRNDKAVIPDSDIDVSGTGNATYTVEIPTTVSAKADKTYSFYLWDKTVSARPKLLDQGKFIITYAGTSGTT